MGSPRVVFTAVAKARVLTATRLRDVWSNPDNDLVAIKYSASF